MRRTITVRVKAGFDRIFANFFAFVLLLTVSALAATPSFAAVTFRAAASASSASGGAITYVGSGAAVNASGGNVAPAYPAGWAAGDLLLCIIESRDNIVSTMPAGWTVLSAANSGATHRATIFWKLAATGDTTPTVTHSGGNVVVAQIAAFRGVDTTTPFDVANSFTVSAADLTTEAAAITTVSPNVMLVFTAHMADNHTTLGVPAGSAPWAQAFFSATATGNDASIGMYYGLRAVTGVQAAVTSTRTGAANAISHGAQIALRPAVATFTINKPAGTSTGDVMIASVSVTPSTMSIASPVGWTSIRQVTQAGATSSVMVTYYRVCGVGEPASFTWTLSGGAHSGAAGGIASFSGVDNTAPIDAEAGGVTSSALTHVAPSVTTTLNNGMLVTIHEFTSSATWTVPGGMTEAVDVASLVAPNANGISMEINYESRVTAGATGTRTATASANADTGATQSVALKATPLICFTDDFNRADGSPGTDWTISSSSGAFGNPVIVSNRLRLTNASGNVATMATLQRLFPGAGNRIEVEFDHYAYGGTGADGIGVVFSNSAVTPVPGAYGGSLGYAQKTLAGGAPADIPGFAGGWLGVGVDEFGNFSNPTEGRVGGPGARVDSVAIRGSGSGFANTEYRYHTGTATLVPQVDNNGAASPAHRYRIIVDHSNAINAFVSVERDTGSGYVTLIAPYDAKAQAGQAVVPTNWLMSYTGSTGGSTNIHEIDNLNICAATQTPVSGIHHFDITVGPSASTCASQSVTIVAKDASNSTLTGYTGTVRITTSSAHGDWASPAVNGAADDGVATYTFLAANNGVVTVALTNTHADDLTVNVTDIAVPATSSTSATTISFRDSSFVITPDPIQIAGRNQTMTVKLLTGGSCSTDTNYTGSKNLDAWLTLDPSDPGGAAPTINGVSLPNTAPASNPASNNLPAITFTNGVATITMVTTDVGRYVLNLRDDTRLYANAVDLGGASSSITTRPWLHVAVAGNTGNNLATGSIVTSAGTAFSATVRGVLWQVADDANNDGVPDAGADLSNNSVASSYAWLTALSAISPYTPAAGTLGTLSNGNVTQASFSGGSASVTTLQYSEVGSFTMQAVANNYLNSGINVTTANGVVGRFTPAYFNVARTDGCSAGNFTYSGQSFSVTVTAYSALNNITANYAGSLGFAKDVVLSIAGDTSNFGGTNNFLAGNFVGGTRIQNVTYTFPLKETAALTPSVLPAAPTTPLRATETGGDGISSVGHSEPQMDIRSGRILIQNAFGSELVDLAVPMRAQYFVDANTGWVTNTVDTCTAVTLSFPPASYTGNLSSGETCVQDSGSPGLSGIGCAVAGPSAPVDEHFRESPIVGFNGDFNLYLKAPGIGNDGSVDVTTSLAALLPWLQYDWNGTGLTDPKGRATFGIYKGSPRNIYLRERY